MNSKFAFLIIIMGKLFNKKIPSSLQLRSESVAENRRARARWEGRQVDRERRAAERAGLA